MKIGLYIKEEKVQVVKLSQNHINLLEKFCQTCKEIGFQNNSSLTNLKWGDRYDLHNVPDYWAVILDNKIVSLSGCHSYNESFTKLRVLFRSATLPEYSNIIKGISKNHMNSIPFSILLPLQINFGLENSFNEFIITTTPDQDNSGHMFRTNRVLHHLAKLNIVTFMSESNYYYTKQLLWRVNLEQYFKALSNFYKVNTTIADLNNKL
jgi:hypothetical protein